MDVEVETASGVEDVGFSVVGLVTKGLQYFLFDFRNLELTADVSALCCSLFFRRSTSLSIENENGLLKPWELPWLYENVGVDAEVLGKSVVMSFSLLCAGKEEGL